VQQREWRTADLLTQAQPVDSATFQQALPAEQQALVYYIAGADVLCFLVERNRIQVKRRLCSLAELTQAQAELRFQLGRIELGPDYFARHAARLQHALKAALYDLYRLLVAPLEPQLGMPRLLVIAYGPLHLVPFHALWDGNAFLVERFEWNYAPSASLFVQSHRETEDAADLASLAGLALTDPSIPAARREVEMAARHFERAWLYLNENASYRNLHAAATQADILHLATHGLFRPDNPFFSALKLADGWIAVREIYRLPLTARLVILSACESGLGRVRGGDEVIGLARGFLGAGARSLLVSLWTVHDASAAELMDRFYTHLVNSSSTCRPTTALRMAQLDAIRDDQHPYFWAPFFLIG
jgi:CHAT domain-containing protein